jgi:hypothetical protein
MAALFLFVVAVAGAVVVGDLVWENPWGAEVTVFGQPVTGYSRGWLLAGAPCWALSLPCCWWPRWATKGRRERRRNSAGCSVIDVITDPSREPNPPACWTSGSAVMTASLDLAMLWPGLPPARGMNGDGPGRIGMQIGGSRRHRRPLWQDPTSQRSFGRGVARCHRWNRSGSSL